MDILKWFTDNYSEMIADMKACSHNLSELELSPYHAEGDVWTHTMMVYSQLPRNASLELKLSALLHDIGKPFCQVIKEGKGRVSFTGHEHYTSFKAIDVLNKFEDDISSINKENILFAINYHDILHKIVKSDDNGEVFISDENKDVLNHMFDQNLELYDLLFELGFADMKGRISVDMDLSIKKYELLRNYVPYKGIAIPTEKLAEAHFIIGLPGSGKSTKANELLKNDSNLVYLSIDEIIMSLNKYSFDYNGAWSPERQKEATGILLEKMKECVDKKQSFILDAANLSEKIRWRRLNHISNKFHKVAHVMLAGECFIENVMKKRKDKNVPISNIFDMSKDFVYPSLKEFDEIRTKVLK